MAVNRVRFGAAMLAAIAAMVVTIALGGERALASNCAGDWASGSGGSGYADFHAHQGGPDRGPYCDGFGGNQHRPLAFHGDGHKAGFIHPSGTPCDRAGRWADPHHRHFHGVPVTFYYVWAEAPGYENRPTVLVCSHEHYRVDTLTIGPGEHGASLPCPEIAHGRQTHPINGGLHWRTYGQVNMKHVQGSFGRHNDGYWHYKFHNWYVFFGEDHVSATLEGFCKYWGTPKTES